MKRDPMRDLIDTMDNLAKGNKPTKGEMRQLQFAQDEYGREMMHQIEYRRLFHCLANDVFGSGPDIQLVKMAGEDENAGPT